MSQSTIAQPETPRTERPAPAAAPSVSSGRQNPVWNWIKTSISTLAVLCALVAFAAWGHMTEWKLPRFSSLIGSEAIAVDDWCADHNVPESECIECHPELVSPAVDHGWCKEHGISQCPFEHSDVIQLAVRPVTSADDLARAERALALRPRAENNSRCTLHQKRIQFASIDALNRAGVDIALVQKRPVIEAVTANGEIIFDETHSAHLSSRAAGTVWRVEKQVGEQVEKGEVLALVDSSEVGEAKAEFLEAIARLRLATANSERLKPLAADGVVAGRQIREAETALQEAQIRLLRAQQRLGNLGFNAEAADYESLST